MRDDDVVERLAQIAHHDWEHSDPLDLSDAGLLVEFDKHKMDETDSIGSAQRSRKAQGRVGAGVHDRVRRTGHVSHARLQRALSAHH